MLKKIKNNWPWLVLIFGLIALHSQHQLDSDEGVVLNAAWNIYNGRHLYFDTFEFIPPLAPYLIAWWWKIVGLSFLSAAVISWLIVFSGCVGLYLISKKMKIKTWRFFAPCFFIVSSSFWPIINHNAFNIVAIIWCLYFLINNQNKNVFYFLGGLFLGLSLLLLQHKTAILFIFITAYFLTLVYKKEIAIKKLLFFVIAASLPSLITLLFWPPVLLWQNLIIFPLKNYTETNSLPLTLLFFSLIASLCLLAPIFLNKNRKDLNSYVLLTISGLALLLSSLPRPDANHVFQALTPLLILIALSFELYLRRRYDKLIVVFVWLVCLGIYTPKPLFNSSVTSRFIREINTSCPKGTLYAGPFLPGLYFETRSLSTTPFSMLITRQHTKEQFLEAANILQKDPPTCAVINYETVKKFQYSINNPVDIFLQNNYKIKKQVGNVIILVQK